MPTLYSKDLLLPGVLSRSASRHLLNPDPDCQLRVYNLVNEWGTSPCHRPYRMTTLGFRCSPLRTTYTLTYSNQLGLLEEVVWMKTR